MSEKIPVWSWRDAIWKAKYRDDDDGGRLKELPSGAKLVCLAIAEHLSDAGKTWRIPVKVIMEMTGFSNRVVANHLATAKKAGLLAIKREMGPHGRRGITRYAPMFPDYMDLDRKPAEFMEDAPSDETTLGTPGDETSLRDVLPSDETSFRPSDETSRQEAFYQEDTLHQKEAFHQGAAQARPTAKVEPVYVAQPKSKKPKAGKVDLLGETIPKRTRTTKTPFPENPDPELTEQWLAFGESIGMTEEDTQTSLVNCALFYRGEGKTKADWTPVVQKWLLGDRDRKRKQANGARRGPVSNDDAFAMAGI